MPRAAVFRSVSEINRYRGVKPSPMRALEPHVAFSTGVLGFTLAGRDEQSAALRRDAEALRQDFLDAGATPGAIEVQEYAGRCFRLFFLKEDYDNYCFCFGEPA